uniref:Uncharacterized protein n=1 Tax=Arion vulgaris TaxID=1028688 RepID=A0A0B6Y9K7_9EUPU
MCSHTEMCMKFHRMEQRLSKLEVSATTIGYSNACCYDNSYQNIKDMQKQPSDFKQNSTD